MAPPAERVADPPGQIDSLLTVTVGFGFTVSVDVATEVHVPVVPVIV
jgi:hypothetical protein